MMRGLFAFSLALFAFSLLPGAATFAQSGQTFRDWRAECQPDAGCSAATGGGDGAPTLALDRVQGEEGWFLRLDFPAPIADPERPLTLSVDGAKIVLEPKRDYVITGEAGRGFVTGNAQFRERVMRALLDGSSATLTYIDVTGEPRLHEVSLAGLSAAMLWIEEQGGLVGQPRIAVAPEGVEGAAPEDRAEAVEESGTPVAVLARHAETSDCEASDSELMRDIPPVSAAVSETAILYAMPCTSGAYNIAYRLYLRETGEIGGLSTLYFPTFSRDHGWGGTDLLFNVSAEGPKLTAFYKGRGVGDCGTIAEWTWVEYAYRLDRFAAQEECDGTPPERWPVVYQAK